VSKLAAFHARGQIKHSTATTVNTPAKIRSDIPNTFFFFHFFLFLLSAQIKAIPADRQIPARPIKTPKAIL